MLQELELTNPTTELASRSEFAEAMSALASSVVIVTCRLGGRPWGMTATAFASVSADPPIVLVSLKSDALAARAINATQTFGVSILAAEQRVLARYASAPGKDKFLEPFTEASDESGVSPSVAGALAQLDCAVYTQLQIADHMVFFGRVRTARTSPVTAPPLLYHRRDYGAVADSQPNGA